MADTQIGELLEAELALGSPDIAGLSLPSIRVQSLMLPGLNWSENTTQLAELLSDDAPKSSKAYKRARRQAERWNPSPAQARRGVKPRQPKLSSRQELLAARRQQTDRMRRLKLHGADMRLQCLWYAGSQGRKLENLPPGGWIHIPQRDTRTVIRMWADGHADAAAELLWFTFLERYGVGNPMEWLADAEVIGLTLRPAGGEDTPIWKPAKRRRRP